MSILRTCILSQGSEILDGSIQNTNARWLSSYFANSQYEIVEHITIGDNKTHLVATYQRLASRIRYHHINWWYRSDG